MTTKHVKFNSVFYDKTPPHEETLSEPEAEQPPDSELEPFTVTVMHGDSECFSADLDLSDLDGYLVELRTLNKRYNKATNTIEIQSICKAVTP